MQETEMPHLQLTQKIDCLRIKSISGIRATRNLQELEFYHKALPPITHLVSAPLVTLICQFTRNSLDNIKFGTVANFAPSPHKNPKFI